ncbi:MAG: hypothetical protein ACRC80_35935 [Waterburya sp.]
MIHQEINVLQLEQKHADDYQKSLSIPVRVELPIEIDSDIEFDTELFRVWYGMSNLGVFRDSNDGWLAEPFYGNPGREQALCASADQARDVIVAAYQAARGIF